MGVMSYVGLVDCNNFFVSCERLFRPDLAGKPVVVLSSNDGCIVARSKEVKDLGVPMGVPYFKVKGELAAAGATIFSSNFTLYRDISARVMEVLRATVANAEQYSVDEAFFTLPDAPHETTHEELVRVKRAVETQVGVPVSVGAARTKTIAKCATERAKAGVGTELLVGEEWQQAARTYPLPEVWGIGGRTAQRMREIGLTTVADLLAADRQFIHDEFGVAGARLRAELSEMRTHGRARDELQQSIMSTRSFRTSTEDRTVIEDAIAYHVAHVAEELREIGASAGVVRVLIRPSRHGEWVLRGGTAAVVLTIPTDDTRVILREALVLVRQLFEPGVPYKKAGVVLSGIVPRATVAPSLFATPSSVSELFSAIDTLNDRFGPETVSIGRTGREDRWQPSKEHVSPRYTTSWSEIRTVMA